MMTSPLLASGNASAPITPPVAPGRLPGIGHLPFLVQDPMGFMRSLLPIGDVVRIYLGSRPMYVVNSLDLVFDVLVTSVENYKRGVIFEKAERVLGQGLTVSEGEVHLKHRKMIQPVLQRHQVDRYSSVMIDVAQEIVGSWTRSDAVDVNQRMHALGMDMFCRALFRNQLAADAAARVKQATPSFMAGIIAQSLYPAEWLEKLPLPVNRRFGVARSQMESAVAEIVRVYRSSEMPAHTPTNTPQDDGQAILSMLMAMRDEQSGQGMNDSQLRDEIINLVVAGAEAPGTTLAWLFYELSQRPDIEQEMRKELAAELGDSPLTVASLKGLSFTRAIIKETLRLHTPTWLLTRRAVQAAQLGGYLIPAGAEVAFSLTTLHRCSSEYTNSTRFEPRRWLDDRSAKLSRSAYLPFAAGKHRCLGEHFSQQVLLIALVTIAQKWQLRMTPGAQVREECVALVQAQGLRMDFLSRPARHTVN